MTTTWTHARGPRDMGAFVRRVRRAQGLSQAELADRLGLTRQYVSELESGEPNLYARRLFEVLGELGVTVRLDAPERPDGHDGDD